MSDEFDGQIVLADDMFYAKEYGTRDMIPVPWDRLVGGDLKFTELTGCGKLRIRNQDGDGYGTLTVMWGPKESFEDFVRRLVRKGWLPGMSYAWGGGDFGVQDVLCFRFINPRTPDIPGDSNFRTDHMRRICDTRLDEVLHTENPFIVELVQHAETWRERYEGQRIR
jgi:hypothetical protein